MKNMKKNETKENYNNACQRNYGIDLLRIVSMIMVVMLHVLGHGGLLYTSLSYKYWFVWYLEGMAFVAVNCYALISGYVGVDSKYKVSNLAMLWCRVLFYSVSLTLICKLIFPEFAQESKILFSFFPILTKRYWYFSAYAVLFLFIPFINAGIRKLSKNEMKYLIIAIVAITSMGQLVEMIFSLDSLCLGKGYSPWWLLVLYMIGAYIRKYGLFTSVEKHRIKLFLFMYLSFISFTWFFKFLINIAINHFHVVLRLDISEDMFYSYQSITILLASVFLFLAFSEIRVKSGFVKIIEFFAPLSFSVYLIHDQEQIRDYLVMDKFTWISRLPLYKMIPVFFGAVLAIFLGCSFIDLIRQFIFDKIRLKEKLQKLEINMRGEK